MDRAGSVIDVFPSICYFANIDSKNLFLEGNNFFCPEYKKLNSKKIIYAETDLGKVPHSVQTERYKLIYNSKSDDFEFYNRHKDPEEKSDHYKDKNSQKRKLKASLLKIINFYDNQDRAKPRKLDKETIEQLRSLGYIK